MMSAQEKKILKEYGALMQEVKVRLTCTTVLIHEPPADIPQGMLKEFCFLQFRMICELMALGCLLAHAGINGIHTARLRREFAADRIVAELEKLHIHFFPLAFTPAVDARGRFAGGSVAEEKDDPLTKKELIRLYGLCGSILHRGDIERYRSGKPTPNSNKDEAIRWADKLRDLLENHVIALHGMDKLLVCLMRLASDDPVVTIFLREPPSPPQ